MPVQSISHFKVYIQVSLALLVACALVACSMLPEASAGDNQPFVVVERKSGEPLRFDVEIARTNKELFRGLRHREHLAADAGMLFDLGRVRLTSFTMSDTLISLDMLFLSKTGEIVQMYQSTEPLHPGPYPSDKPVLAVLEVPGGTARSQGIAIGDRVLHPIFEKKK